MKALPPNKNWAVYLLLDKGVEASASLAHSHYAMECAQISPKDDGVWLAASDGHQAIVPTSYPFTRWPKGWTITLDGSTWTASGFRNAMAGTPNQFLTANSQMSAESCPRSAMIACPLPSLLDTS